MRGEERRRLRTWVAVVAVAGPAAGAGRQRWPGTDRSTRRSSSRAAAHAASRTPAAGDTLGTGGHRCRARGRRRRLGDLARTDHAAGHRGPPAGHRRWRWRTEVASDGAGRRVRPAGPRPSRLRAVRRPPPKRAATSTFRPRHIGSVTPTICGVQESRRSWPWQHLGLRACWYSPVRADWSGTARPRQATRCAPAERQDL